MVTGSRNFHFLHPIMCSSRKNPCPPHGRSSEIPRGRGVLKAKILKAKYEANLEFLGGKGCKKTATGTGLGTFALIVSAHPYCARNSLPRHALSARAVGEMWRYIALVGTLVSMHEFNSLKCSVTPYFLLINHFVCQLSTF